MFLVEPVFSRYFRKFLMTSPTAEMSKGYIDRLLNFQIFLGSSKKFLYFVIICLGFKNVMGQGKFYIYYKCCFILSIDDHYIRSVKNLEFFHLC